ncbi:MAG: nitric-oxide reductase large subunit, partial [Rhodanobacter sp.]
MQQINALENDSAVVAELPLSPWWVRCVLIVLVLGLSALLAITFLAYRNAPPVPQHIVDSSGATVFTGDDIRAGQGVFLKYGLMDNGSIWGHGAYLGPDYSAEALHQIGQDSANALAVKQYNGPLTALSPGQRAGVQAQVAELLKTNRYDAATGTLTLTPAESEAYRQQVGYWTDYFKHPDTN